MAREFEVKYRLTPEAFQAIREAFGPFRAITMETTYYDTPGGDFSARKWTVRKREENGISICALKTPGQNGGRGEWETPCPDILTALPVLIRQGAPAEIAELAAKGLTELCRASFTRQAALISVGDSLLELALDRGQLLGGGKAVPLFELEAEVKEGSDADALAFGKKMEQDYGLAPEPDSKFKRARSLARERR